MTERSEQGRDAIPPEVAERVSVLSAELLECADAMVALLNEHGESKWADNFARLAGRMRDATTQTERRDAVQYLRSFFGGMGSWNDFYLTALGEAEAERESLTGQLSRTGHELFELVTAHPDPPKPGFFARLFGRKG